MYDALLKNCVFILQKEFYFTKYFTEKFRIGFYRFLQFFEDKIIFYRFAMVQKESIRKESIGY